MKKLKNLIAALVLFSLASCFHDDYTPHEHSFSDEWSYDEDYHYHKSTRNYNAIADKGPHVMGDWQIETHESETNAGLKYRKCKICEYRINETIPQKLEFTLIENNSFYSVKAASRNLEGSISIPEVFGGKSVTTISESGFKLCTDIKSISIPKTIINIEDKAFSNCTLVESITFSYGLKTIGNRAFHDIDVLTELQIPDSVTSIGEECFSYCDSLKSIKLSDKITVIPKNSFSNCLYLKEIMLPDYVTEIGENAFSNCKNLISIFLPKSLSSVANIFSSCEKLENVTFEGTIEEFKAIKGDFGFTVATKVIHCSDGDLAISQN